MIAVWYHTILSGGSVPVDTEFACRILQSQMRALKDSGLLAESDEFHVGLNGDPEDAEIVRLLSPCPKVDIRAHGAGSTSEIPTMKWIQEWLPKHRDWFVLYHHAKGVTHFQDAFYSNWRTRMERACIRQWPRCIRDLENGADAVGCHWLTPEQWPDRVTSPFFGGTFWWAKSAYLLQLPQLPEATWKNRFEAESWIGRRRPYPRIVDYYPGWP